MTVLFADLVGSTALAEAMDPEQVKRLIERCFEGLVDDIESFGGRVDKLLGDAIVALFGAPVAHEDDAERAVRAALRMHETLTASAADPHDGLPPLQMRIGINTGEVLVGTLVGTDYTAMGDVVNTASRLQSLAPPGRVLVGRATAALLSPAVSLEAFGETVIRGRREAEQPWLVAGATSAGQRPLRSDVSFVGRRPERAVLEAAVGLVRAGRSGLVTIVGEAGSGKTRLVTDLLTCLGDEPVVLHMSGAPYGDRNAWAALASTWSPLFGLVADADLDAIGDAVDRRATELWGLAPGAPELAPYVAAIAHTLGLPSELDQHDPAGAADRLAEIMAEMVRRHAQRRFTVLFLDNVQWVSPPVLRLLGIVVRSLRDTPVLVLSAERPDSAPAWPPPGFERLMVTRLPLTELSRSESRAVVRQVLDLDAVGDEAGHRIIDELVDRGGGNPLFLIELAQLAACGRAGAELPGTLRALIASRLDQLPAAQREIVDNAAMLGTGDTISPLQEFAAHLGQSFDAAALAALAADGILDVRDGWWRFRSEVVREVAYQTMTKQTRAARHAGVATALRAHEATAEQLAHHSATAAELIAELGPVRGVAPEVLHEAVGDLAVAAEQALSQGRAMAAHGFATRALVLGPPTPSEERQLLTTRASSELEQRRFPEAQRDARRVIELAMTTGDRHAEAEGRRRLGTAAHHLGDLATARIELDAAVATFRDLADPATLADALRARGFAEVFGGSLETGRQILLEALALYRQLGDERGHAWTHHNLAWVAFQSGDTVEAKERLAEASARFETLSDRAGVNWANGLGAYVLYFQRRFEESEALARKVTIEARRWGDDWATLMMHTLVANLRLWSGRLEEAEAEAARALAGFRAAGDRYGIMQALAPLTRAQAALGRLREAERGSEELVGLGHSFGELGLALQGAAGVAVHLGRAEAACELADQVLDRLPHTGSLPSEGTVLKALSLAQLGRLDEALMLVEPLDVGDFPFGRAARALVRALVGDRRGARSDARMLEGMPAPSYFDRALTRLALVLIAAPGSADRAAAVASFRQLVSSVGDAPLLAVADALDGRASLAPAGWSRLVDPAGVVAD